MGYLENKICANMSAILSYFRKGRALELRILANDLIRHAVKLDNKVLAEQSVIAYVLHKILTKEHIISSRTWPKNKARILEDLEKMVLYLRRSELENFENTISHLHINLERIDDYFGRFVQGLLDKARVKYAADAYFMGVSLGHAAQLLGADKKTLIAYIGATKFYDKETPLIGIEDRLKNLKKALGD